MVDSKETGLLKGDHKVCHQYLILDIYPGSVNRPGLKKKDLNLHYLITFIHKINYLFRLLSFDL